MQNALIPMIMKVYIYIYQYGVSNQSRSYVSFYGCEHEWSKYPGESQPDKIFKSRLIRMAWKPQPRFNLLLLENGEYFLEVNKRCARGKTYISCNNALVIRVYI